MLPPGSAAVLASPAAPSWARPKAAANAAFCAAVVAQKDSRSDPASCGRVAPAALGCVAPAALGGCGGSAEGALDRASAHLRCPSPSGSSRSEPLSCRRNGLAARKLFCRSPACAGTWFG